MADPKADALVKSVESLVAEKEAVAAKEKELIDSLNAALGKMGYKVVSSDAGPVRRGRRRGRPPGSGRKGGPDQPPKNGRRKRRGRSPKETQSS